MSRRPTKVNTAPMAVASDGSLIVNAYQLAVGDDLAAVTEVARKSGLLVFVGVVVPERLRRDLMRDLDDAMADVVGRPGPRLARYRRSGAAPLRP
jgi:hypothetical protein